MLDWVANRLLAKSLKLIPKNTQSENMCGIVFEKAKGRSWTVNRTSFYGEAAIRRVLEKRCYEKFCKIHKKTSVPVSLFGAFLSILRNV